MFDVHWIQYSKTGVKQIPLGFRLIASPRTEGWVSHLGCSEAGPGMASRLWWYVLKKNWHDLLHLPKFYSYLRWWVSPSSFKSPRILQNPSSELASWKGCIKGKGSEAGSPSLKASTVKGILKPSCKSFSICILEMSDYIRRLCQIWLFNWHCSRWRLWKKKFCQA